MASTELTPGLYFACEYQTALCMFCRRDYNFQATFYGTSAANHPELSDSYVQAILEFVPKARESARVEFQCPGLNFAAAIGPHGMLSAHVGDCGMRQDAVFAAVNIATRWLWTRDKHFLTNTFGTESTPYSFLKETVAFWDCYLVADVHGVLHDLNDCVGELCGRTNEVDNDPLMSLALLRFATNALLSASVALERDASLRPQWQTLLCDLAAYPTITRNGTTLFVTSANRTDLEASMALYPGSVVAGDNCSSGHSFDSVANITRSTIGQMGSDFFQAYSFTKGFTAALLARVDKQVVFPALMRNLRPCTDSDNLARDMNGAVCLQRNGLADNHNGGGLETIGGMDLVHNLVLQSRDGVLRFFPWLSEDFTRCSFTRLRALGGLVVSAKYSAVAGGVLSPILVEFPDEGQLCEVEVPSGWLALHVCLGGDEVVVQAHTHTSSFWGSANSTYTLQSSSCSQAGRH